MQVLVTATCMLSATLYSEISSDRFRVDDGAKGSDFKRGRITWLSTPKQKFEI